MKPKYTESPWYVGNDLCGEWYIHNNKGLVCSLETPVSQDYFTGNLIAAAPELYQACVEFVRKVECGEARSTKSYEQMKQAIAKANGDTVSRITSANEGETNHTLTFAMEFELPSFCPDSLSPTGMKEDSSGLFTYRAYALELKSRVKELEQQLSDSISKDELRRLVEKMEQDQHFAWSASLQTAIDKLNKLIEGGNND